MDPSTTPDYLIATRALLLEGLIKFYLSGESDQGISSSWAPLVNIAQGGFGARPDPERMVTNHRYGMAGVETSVTEARRVRTALQNLSAHPATQDLYGHVLAATHGAESWKHRVDNMFGQGVAHRVAKRFGNLTPVASMTEVVTLWHEASALSDKGTWKLATSSMKLQVPASWGSLPQVTKGLWGTRIGWMVALCLDKTESSKKVCARIEKEATELLELAEAAYLGARGVVVPKRERVVVKKIKTPPKRKMFDPFARPFEDMQ